MEEKKKGVWITGAGSGIGKAIALEFVKNDIITIASGRRKELLDKLKLENKKNIKPFPLDVTDTAAVKRISNKIFNAFDINCLINNAGITSFSSAEEDSMKTINKIIQTNLMGAIAAIKSVLPYFKKREGGIIINILSVAANTIFKNSSAYSASKAGLLAYTNVLREEVREDNIKVINLLPGATKTPIWQNEMLEKFSSKMMNPEDMAKFIYQLYSLESNLVPEEITIRPVTGDL
jgi:short-subunit dehydrogenase